MKCSSYIFILFLLFSFQIIPNKEEMGQQSATKNPALIVLENKCNACHLKKKRVFFDEENMEQHAPEIYKQVFVKQRMPKGKKNQLTTKEIEILKNWLKETGINFQKK